mmetsp:Transcript_20007/g.46567  ORF Transcript_20007/g.46567 Transcript_20007/m.46567 type:complete len:370 (-) Transcript_20007:58-1167(-)
MAQRPLRVGILGAARNVPFSAVQPVQKNADLASRVEVVGLASVTAEEAAKACKEWGIPKAYSSFDELLQDKTIEAVYNVISGPLRCEWTIRALMAGKHVLTETPLSSNAREAVLIQRAAEDAGRVMLEGSHPTCHPVSKRVREMIVDGVVGRLEQIDLDLPIGHSLSGRICASSGSMMSLGCHGLAIIRTLAGEEAYVTGAQAQVDPKNAKVDLTMTCDFQMPSGAVAHLRCSVDQAKKNTPSTYKISGTNGIIQVKEWFTGGRGSHRIEVEQFEGCGEKSVEHVGNASMTTRDTFYFQWMAFVDEVRGQQQRSSSGMPWDYSSSSCSPTDAVRNMALMDAVYSAAGLPIRQSTNAPPPPYNVIGMSKL